MLTHVPAAPPLTLRRCPARSATSSSLARAGQPPRRQQRYPVIGRTRDLRVFAAQVEQGPQGAPLHSVHVPGVTRPALESSHPLPSQARALRSQQKIRHALRRQGGPRTRRTGSSSSKVRVAQPPCVTHPSRGCSAPHTRSPPSAPHPFCHTARLARSRRVVKAPRHLASSQKAPSQRTRAAPRKNRAPVANSAHSTEESPADSTGACLSRPRPPYSSSAAWRDMWLWFFNSASLSRQPPVEPRSSSSLISLHRLTHTAPDTATSLTRRSSTSRTPTPSFLEDSSSSRSSSRFSCRGRRRR